MCPLHPFLEVVMYEDCIPDTWLEEELSSHLVEDHNVPPDRLVELREVKTEEEWIEFLEVAHDLLHKAESDDE